MVQLLIKYDFSDTNTTSENGSFPISFIGSNKTSGPGDTLLGKFDEAIDLGSSGKAQVELTGLQPDKKQFCIRIVFQTSGQVIRRQNLVECTLLPFSMYIDKGATAKEFVFNTYVWTTAHDWNGPSTSFKQTLKTDTWYTATLVYDNDTAVLTIDEKFVSVYAFPDGRIKQTSDKKLFFGTGTDGQRDHFKGKLAAFRWYNGIPEEIQCYMDEYRTYAEWFVTYKYESVRNTINFGQPKGALTYMDSIGAYIQHYVNGAIMYHDSIGIAFEMHGSIYTKYISMDDPSKLGYLISDECNTIKAPGKKNVFSYGAIYWSIRSGVVPVLGQIYRDYENLGESGFLGFPVKTAEQITNGIEQRFQNGQMYYRNGASNAKAVQGVILTKFLSAGGTAKWGFPVINESDVMKKVPRGLGSYKVGRVSKFENCIIYWNNLAGAHIIWGDILQKHEDMGGPTGSLGFPTSDVQNIPGFSGVGTICSFQNGSLVAYGTPSTVQVVGPFKIFIGVISTHESEFTGMGENDLYCYIKVKDGSKLVYNKRHPNSGDWGGNNIYDFSKRLPPTLIPNDVNKTIIYSVDVWDSDPNGDDHLGKYTKVLNASNAWGFMENNGNFKSGHFDKIRNIDSSVQPDVDPASLREEEKYWHPNVYNRGTNEVGWQKYATAFKDVDSDTEWWDSGDWIDQLYHQFVIKGIAKNGNCFGMSLEAIYSRLRKGIFGLPINRFKDWKLLEPMFNVKHCYQAGADPLWFFVNEVLSGSTHNPKDVFINTRDLARKGHPSVISLFKDYWFREGGHAILPIAWDDSSKPWKIKVWDSNFPNDAAPSEIKIDPDKNRFDYLSSYKGGQWDGARLFFYPYSLLDERVHIPVWDLIMMLITGTIILLGEDIQTESITDADGNDIDAFGKRATDELKSGNRPEGVFINYKGIGQHPIPKIPGGRITPKPIKIINYPIVGEMLLRSEQFLQGMRVGVSHFTHLPIGILLSDPRLRTLNGILSKKPKICSTIANRSVYYVVNDPAIRKSLPGEVKTQLENVLNANAPLNFIHNIKGIRDGQLVYLLKHKINVFKITSEVRLKEKHKLSVNNLGTGKNTIYMAAERNKMVKFEVSNKLGVKNDKICITVDQIPVSSQQGLNINLRQGLGGLELVNTNSQTNIPVYIEAVIEGKKIKRQFNIPLDGGVRIKPTSVLNENLLTISKIDRIFGPTLKTDVLRGIAL